MPQKVSRSGWLALMLVAATQLLSLLDRQILAILAPRIKHDLHIGDAEMGLLYGTVFALFYALFSLPLGRLADGWTRTRLLALCIAAWSLATGLAAFAAGFALLAISRLGVGIGEAGGQPAGTSLVFDHFPKPRRGLAMAVLASAIALGLGLSSLLGGVAADWWDGRFPQHSGMLGLSGWQFAFLVAALPGPLLAVALWRLAEPRRGVIDGIIAVDDPAPFRASGQVLGAVVPGFNWLAMARRRATRRDWAVNLASGLAIVMAARGLATVCARLSPRPPLRLGAMLVDPHMMQWSIIGLGLYVLVNLAQSLKASDPPAHALLTGSPSLLICMSVGSLQSMINYGVMAFTPAFLMKTYHLSATSTGLQFGLLAAGLGVIGPMIAGPLSDRLNRLLPGGGRVWVVVFALGLSPLLAIWTFHAHDAASFYARFVAYSLVLTMWMPPLYAVMYDQVLPRMRAITASTYIVIMTIIGLGIGPYAVGLVSDASGGDLRGALLSINWVAPVIVVLLLILVARAAHDERQVTLRARAAGEPL